MTTPIQLIDELVGFIKETVKEYDLSTKVEGISKAPDVHPGYLPSKSNEDDATEFPYVIVRYLTETESDENVAAIRLLIGTHSEDEQNGWRDPLNIATRIKIELKKVQVIGSFSLTGTMRTELFEEQPFPYWFAMMDLNFHIPQVQMDWSEHDFDF